MYDVRFFVVVELEFLCFIPPCDPRSYVKAYAELLPPLSCIFSPSYLFPRSLRMTPAICDVGSICASSVKKI